MCRKKFRPQLRVFQFLRNQTSLTAGIGHFPTTTLMRGKLYYTVTCGNIRPLTCPMTGFGLQLNFVYACACLI
jgi:hypothetical protein